jgi:hypothetical protein
VLCFCNKLPVDQNTFFGYNSIIANKQELDMTTLAHTVLGYTLAFSAGFVLCMLAFGL